MAKKASDFRYNTGETRVPWAAVGENYNAEDVMAVIRFMMQGKGEDFKKIKLVDIMDMIHDDIKKTGHDSYIGKYANSYDNRCLLITAIQGYLDTLETEGLLERNQNTVSIDIQAVKNWRESNGLNTKAELAVMKDQTIKELNIHDNVFLAMDLSILDAIENITVKAVVQ